MQNYKEGFPVLKKYIYANTASSGLIHESTIAKIICAVFSLEMEIDAAFNTLTPMKILRNL